MRQCKKQVVRTTIPFDEALHRPYLAKPGQTIRGQAFLRQRGGGNVTCAGREVMMIPDTAYFGEIFDIARRGATAVPGQNHQVPKEFASLRKMSMCDAQGNFEFENVAPGRWFIATEVVWEVGSSNQGGGLLKRIEVAEGQTGRVFLTDQDRVGN